MTTALIFILVLAVLIFVHELGHFLVARWCGIRVDAFKIGFGPKIFAWKRGETEYGVNLIPFGGYVKIHGENPDQDAESGPDAARSFINKPRWKQVAVLAAGVFFNFIFAWMLYVSGFMQGVTATQDGFERYANDFSNERIMVTAVAPGSPAERAGFKIGDVIVGAVKPASVSTSDTFDTDNSSAVGMKEGEKATVEQIQNFIASSNGHLLKFAVSRGESTDLKDATVIEVTPATGVVEGKYAVGIGMQQVADLRLSLIPAISEGFRYTITMIRDTAVSLGTFFLNIFRGSANFSDVAGPVGIAGIVGGAAKLGFSYLIMITALISINLGVINLVPFPALDGGRILFVLIEGVIRRRISMKFTNIVNTVGFVLLMILMIIITYRDVVKLFK